MTPQVKLVVSINHTTPFSLNDTTYSYTEPMECTVGRAMDCDIQLPVTEEKDVSRHHCLFEIEPPYIWVQDLDSKNGTFVNELRISASPEDGMYELRNGDEVRIGHYLIQVQVTGNEVLDDMILAASADES